MIHSDGSDGAWIFISVLDLDYLVGSNIILIRPIEDVRLSGA